MANSNQHDSLPVPAPAALAHSQTLAAHIGAAIDAAGGWLPFDRYMELALYAPGLGYYSAGATKFGRLAEDGSDFVTAPELSPLFARTLGRAAAEALAASDTRALMEFGAGTGKLAAGILAELDLLGVPWESYTIVELSGELRERQRATLSAACSAACPTAAEAAARLARIRWLDALPAAFDGVMLGNEVLDAMPVKLYRRQQGRWHERGVARDPHTDDAVRPNAAAARAAFRYADRVLDAAGNASGALSPDLAAWLAEIDGNSEYGDEYITERNDAAAAFTRTVLQVLGRGALLLIDYGFPRHEYLHPQRSGGTLMCHYRHRAHDDPFLYPGLQDITAHVDFSTIAQAGLAAGADLLGYTSQARFLINCGITDLLADYDPRDVQRFLPVANGVQKLLAESEMGELFKVIGFSRGLARPLAAFARGERSHAL
jgi:SAM-dependent MidA family methyltransferase